MAPGMHMMLLLLELGACSHSTSTVVVIQAATGPAGPAGGVLAHTQPAAHEEEQLSCSSDLQILIMVARMVVLDTCDHAQVSAAVSSTSTPPS